MRKRWLVFAFLGAAFVAFAADDAPPDRIDVELSRGQALATILGEAGAAGAIIAGFFYRLAWRPWRRRVESDRRLVEKAKEQVEKQKQDEHICEMVAVGIATFQRTVFDKEVADMNDAVAKILADHARNADAGLRTMGLAVSGMARTVEDCVARVDERLAGFETRLAASEERMFNFAMSMASGTAPERRRSPRDGQQLLEAPK